jgi:hypothetical protein
MEVIQLALVVLSLMLCAAIGISQVKMWIVIKAFEKSTHQVTYVNPFSGVAASREDAKVAEVDLSEIPNMTEEEKARLREAVNGIDGDTIL